MTRKPYVLAIAALLLMPVVVVLGGPLFNAIDPEIAARHADYERNYRLLEHAKTLTLLAMLVAVVALWFLACALVIRSKGRTLAWLVLALLGPPGLVGIALLTDRTSVSGNRYGEFLAGLRAWQRVAYEVLVYAIVSVGALEAVVLKGELSIRSEAAHRGVAIVQIVAERDASSGMWGFSEGLEMLYFAALFYLLWPVCCAAAARVIAARSR